LFRRAADVEVDAIWVDAMNPRPRVWPSVASLLRKHFPELRDRCQRILFDRQTRRLYLDQLQGRVERAAQRSGLADRVRCCL
jgi:hypothetical protein